MIDGDSDDSFDGKLTSIYTSLSPGTALITRTGSSGGDSSFNATGSPNERRTLAFSNSLEMSGESADSESSGPELLDDSANSANVLFGCTAARRRTTSSPRNKRGVTPEVTSNQFNNTRPTLVYINSYIVLIAIQCTFFKSCMRLLLWFIWYIY